MAKTLKAKGLAIFGNPKEFGRPRDVVAFGKEASAALMEVVEKGGWAVEIVRGQKKHLTFEAWQTVGRFFGCTVKVIGTESVTFGPAQGFLAKASVINKDGLEVGAAEAMCLNDEHNWIGKPMFQIRSMAQTRACAKALRQIFGWVVVLAGYDSTPREEMDEGASKGRIDVKKAVGMEPAAPGGAKLVSNSRDAKGSCVHCGTTGKYHRRDCPNFQKPEGFQPAVVHEEKVEEGEVVSGTNGEAKRELEVPADRMTDVQQRRIFSLGISAGLERVELMREVKDKYHLGSFEDLSRIQADEVIEGLTVA